MLKLLAYREEKQEDLLPTYWRLGIFSPKWDTKYYTLSEEEANETLEHIGNKLPLEKKLISLQATIISTRRKKNTGSRKLRSAGNWAIHR